MIPVHKFKREEHVYINDEFSELLKDAVRFFHGTPVLPLPLTESFKGAGVYAIYCVAKKGIYKTFGARVNRTSYSKPIYVGKVASEEGNFQSMPLDEQLRFWKKCFRTTLGMSACDFTVRILTGCDRIPQNQLYGELVKLHDPIWNHIFKTDATMDDMNRMWHMCHNVRFRRKANDPLALAMRDAIRRFVDAA